MIKVWIFKGEIMEHDPHGAREAQAELQEGGGGRPRVIAGTGVTGTASARAEPRE